MNELKFKYVVKALDEIKISKAYSLETIEDTTCMEETIYEELDECNVMCHDSTNCDCATPFWGNGEIIARLQFTGLIDKNGVVEIYEGDIIQMYSHSFDTNKHEKDTRMVYTSASGEIGHFKYDGDINDIRIVEHRMGTLGLYGKDGSSGAFTHFSNLNRSGQSIEVIGNIYEKPELLESNEKS